LRRSTALPVKSWILVLKLVNNTSTSKRLNGAGRFMVKFAEIGVSVVAASDGSTPQAHQTLVQVFGDFMQQVDARRI
jgi:hypothetical protein